MVALGFAYIFGVVEAGVGGAEAPVVDAATVVDVVVDAADAADVVVDAVVDGGLVVEVVNVVVSSVSSLLN